MEVDSLDKAMDAFEKAKGTFKENENINLLLSTLNNIALVHSYQGNEEQEEAILLETLDLARAHSANAGNISMLLNNLGSFYLDADEFDKALSYFYQSHALARQLEQPVKIQKALDNLSMTHEGLGNLDSALLYQQRLTEINDSIYDIQRTELMAEMQEKYETEKKDKTIQLQKAEMKTTRTRLYFTWGMFGILLVLGSVLVYAWTQRQRAKRLAAQRLAEQEQQRVLDLMRDQEISLLNAMMDGQEQERQRVARELHDRVGSMLSTVKLQLSQLESEGVGLTPTNQLVDDTCEEVRRISHNLEAGMLAEHGLLSALEDLIGSLKAHADFALEVHLFGLEQPLPPVIERHLFAIIQEGFNNVVKYAQATEVHLSLTRHPDHLNLMLEDNGIGFDLAVAQAKGGIGLRNLQHRAEQMGGTVMFDTALTRGTTLILDVPLTGKA